MKRYLFTLKCDTGKVRLSTVATDLQAAIRIVCAAEHCPGSAIIAVRETTPNRRRNT